MILKVKQKIVPNCSAVPLIIALTKVSSSNRTMKWIIIPLCFSLISTVGPLPQEIRLIKRLNEEFNFDQNIILLASSTLDPDHYIASSSSTSLKSDFETNVPQTVYIFESGSGRNTTTDLNPTISKRTLLVIGVDSLDIEDESELFAEVGKIRSVQGSNSLKVLVFLTCNFTTTMNAIERLFDWSWSVGIVNIMCAFHDRHSTDPKSLLNVFQFDPFGPFKLKNVTGSESVQNHFSDKLPNYLKHPLRFLTTNQFPRNKLEEEFWHVITVAFNATELHTDLNLDEYGNHSLTDNSQDIVKHEVPNDDIKKQFPLYPHRRANFVLLVPHALPYSSIMVYLQNSTWERVFLCIFLTIMAASLVLTISSIVRTKNVHFLRCVAIVANLLMNDNCDIRYNQFPRADACLLVPLTFAGLIVMNGILSVYQLSDGAHLRASNQDIRRFIQIDSTDSGQ